MRRLFLGLSKRFIVMSIFLICLFSLLNSIFTTLLSRISNEKDINVIFGVVIATVCFILFWLFIEFCLDMILSIGDIEIENTLFVYYFNKLYTIKPEVLKKHNTGYISGLLQKCAGHQREAFMLFVDIGLNITYVLYFTIIFAREHIGVGFLVIVLSVISNAVRIILRKKYVFKYLSRMIHSWSEKDKTFIDCTSNINTAQRLQEKDFFTKLLTNVGNVHYSDYIKWKIRDEILFIIGKGTSYMFAPLAILITYLTKQELFGNVFYMTLIATVSIQLPHNIRSLIRFVAAYEKFKTSLFKFDEIINDDNVRHELCEEDFKRLQIKDLNYSYSTESCERVTISIPNFEVAKGDFVVIKGESGQGKTTLLNVMTGEIETEHVCINDSIFGQRLNCIFVAQDTEMFDLSVRDNLKLGKDIPDEIIYHYLNEVGMGDWISKQKHGLDTLLGERGVFVSTGQRQRLNLIRGLLCTDKEIYILDEPTSNVDTETEKRMIELIRSTLANKTVVCVTHRQPIVQLSTKQYTFENGILKEELT